MVDQVKILSLPSADAADPKTEQAILELHPVVNLLVARFGLVNAINALLSGFVSLSLGCADPAAVEAALRLTIAQLPALAALRKAHLRKSAN